MERCTDLQQLDCAAYQDLDLPCHALQGVCLIWSAQRKCVAYKKQSSEGLIISEVTPGTLAFHYACTHISLMFCLVILYRSCNTSFFMTTACLERCFTLLCHKYKKRFTEDCVYIQLNTIKAEDSHHNRIENSSCSKLSVWANILNERDFKQSQCTKRDV